MDKGIFYLVCTVVTIGVIAGSTVILHNDIRSEKFVTLPAKEIVLTPVITPSPTATPSGVLRRIR